VGVLKEADRPHRSASQPKAGSATPSRRVEQLRALLASASDMIFRMSPDWSEMSLLDVSGAPQHDPQPTREWINEHVAPQDRAAVFETIESGTASRKAFEFEHRMLRHDGSVAWVHTQAVPVLDENDDLLEWFGLAVDVTDRKNAEDALRESEERQAFLGELGDALAPLINPADIHAVAARLVGTKLGASHAEYMEIDEETGLGVIYADYVRPGFSHTIGTHPLADHCHWSEALRLGPVVIPDTSESSWLTAEMREDLLGDRVRAVIVAPVLEGHAVRSAFCVATSEPRQWTPLELSFVQIAAERTWASTLSARSEMQHAESLRRTSLHKDLLAAVASSLDPRRLSEQVLQTAQASLGLHSGAVYLVDERDGRPHAIADVGYERQQIGMPLDSTSIVGKAIATGEVQLAGAEAASESEGTASAASPIVFRWAALPIVSQGCCIGAVALGFIGHRPFDTEEIDLYTVVSTTLALGLENARLYAEAERARQQATDLIRHAPTGIYEVSFDPPKFLSVNDAMTVLTGYSREELLTMSPREILEPESQTLLGERARAATAGEPLAEQVEYRVRRKDGRLMHVVLNVRPIRDENGRVSRAFVVGHDVTERIEAEAERQRILEAERRASRLAAALNEVNEILLSTLTVDEMLERIVEDSAAAVGARAAIAAEVSGGELVIRHATGFPDEVLGSRYPLSAFPAVARAVEERRPQFIANAMTDAESNRQFAKRYGDQSFMTLPLITSGKVVGTLSYTYDAPQSFDERDAEFASRLSLALSLALEGARHFEAEQLIADRLQEALLELPDRVRGVEFAHAYHSATERARVGGDFYDVFELHDGKLGVVIGDVAGKGLDAAVLTSMVKNTIRAHASERGKTAAHVLELTNEVIFRATPSESFVTVFFGILDCRDGRLTYANAGHTASAIVRARSGVGLLTPTGPLLGAFDSVQYGQGAAEIDLNDLLFLYTDGVTEARRGRELYGEARLIQCLEAEAGKTSEEVIEDVISDVFSFTNNLLRDDLAMLALRRVESIEDGPQQGKLDI
jgi:PAS domain S-box-containing protein